MPSRSYALLVIGAIVSLLILAACGVDERSERSEPSSDGALSAFELEHGIGPFTEAVDLGPIDPQLVATGRDVFQMNCEACHTMDTRFVGPALGDVVERRSPTFILNMIMNPEQMVREHPEGQKMLTQFPLVMPYQNITEDQARAILEYLRTYS